ncbi:hypothetical protein Aple_050720 [Acrocarpospora pleiomorpha]|uniref:Uncharacterized protein n=1 Tax=Acrocarpospora pleiomorpha TaxID=90975 RepID=A0A5M3XLC3_9ACTN|nr:hypothetical protein Aple_050720 [Acrocarpospora pleiomorpha]
MIHRPPSTRNDFNKPTLQTIQNALIPLIQRPHIEELRPTPQYLITHPNLPPPRSARTNVPRLAVVRDGWNEAFGAGDVGGRDGEFGGKRVTTSSGAGGDGGELAAEKDVGETVDGGRPGGHLVVGDGEDAEFRKAEAGHSVSGELHASGIESR